MGKILVTGGAGYIGSHIVRMLRESGNDLVVVDDLSEGHAAAVEGVELVRSDFADPGTLERVLSRERVEFIIHMAAFCEVGQSVKDPAAYYHNNLTRSLNLLDAAVRHRVKGLVFSSTAAVYGEPRELPIDEEHPTNPTNPYGETKLAFERALASYSTAYGLSYVALRYFNAAGAHPDGTLGEDHAVESHLIPLLLRATAPGARPMQLFGTDYPTPDGTCVRDYVHIQDLAQAHVLALGQLRDGAVRGASFNLGNGAGFSILEVVDAVERVTGRRPAVRPAPRRPGDPATLVASSARARETLGWKPAFPDLDSIIRTAWGWHRAHPRGFDDRPAGPAPAVAPLSRGQP